MKRTLRNIIICICIVYFVLSIVNTIVFTGYYNEELEGYDENFIWISSNEKYKEVELQKQYVKGQLNILNDNTNIIIVSVVFGFMIGLLISQRENIIIRYIVVFILGYLLYCVLWTFITILVNKSVSDVISNNFIEIYYNTLPKMLGSYIMFYLAGLIVIIFRNKISVQSLNAILKNPANEQNSEKIFKMIKRTLISILILMLLIFIGNTIRETVILINYSKKVNEISNYNNYYIKEECKDDSGEKDIEERYYKDGVFIRKFNDSLIYSNENSDEILSYNFLKKDAVVELPDSFLADFYKIRNVYWNGTGVRRWRSLLLTFNVNVYLEEYNGKHCYVIEQYSNKTYIDKESYLIVKRVLITGQEYYYTYEFGNVTDEEVKRPD